MSAREVGESLGKILRRTLSPLLIWPSSAWERRTDLLYRAVEACATTTSFHRTCVPKNLDIDKLCILNRWSK
jgi:hypothetical protein